MILTPHVHAFGISLQALYSFINLLLGECYQLQSLEIFFVDSS
jgi:hypothetical protein